MKNKLLICFLWCIPIVAFTQYSPGTYLLGGNGYLEINNQGNTKNRAFSISPEIRIAVLPGLFVGCQFSAYLSKRTYQFNSSTVDFSNRQITRQNGFGMGPSVRYYLPLQSKSRPFVQINSHFFVNNRYIKQSIILNGLENTQSGRSQFQSASLTPALGYSFLANKNIFIDLTFQKSINLENRENNFGGNYAFTFGLQVVLSSQAENK